MNYHLMVQDKFLDSFIEDIYAIGEEKNNIFWFRGVIGETKHVNTDKPIEYLGYDIDIINSKLQLIKPDDNIFIHWYDMWIGDLVYHLPNKLFVFFWGGELYEEPFWHHAKWIHDDITYKIVKKQLYPKFAFSKNIYRLIRNFKKVLEHSSVLKRQYLRKLKQVERIDYIICNQMNTGEIEKIKELYPSFNAIHLPGQYDINFDIANQINKHIYKDAPIKVLVGNSATEANNHLEAFRKLKILKNIEIYCPLSYGSDYYKEIVIKAGYDFFGKRFHPITEFMQRHDYVEFVNQMDLIYMYHNRSQAWGNIATSLTFGKPVFLKNMNALKQFISLIGINTYDVNLIDQYDLESIIFNENQMLMDNIEKLKVTISTEMRLKNLKQIMSIYAN